MSRTKRFYNYPNSGLYEWCGPTGWKQVWHPYKVIWRNTTQVNGSLSKLRRSEYRRFLQLELQGL